MDVDVESSSIGDSTMQRDSLGDMDSATDLSLWRLEVDEGRQVWHYLSPDQAKDWPQTDYDRYWLGLRSKVRWHCCKNAQDLAALCFPRNK